MTYSRKVSNLKNTVGRNIYPFIHNHGTKQGTNIALNSVNSNHFSCYPGAESHVLPLCTGTKNSSLVQRSQSHVDDFVSFLCLQSNKIIFTI